MPIKVALQAGHQNTANNCDIALRTSTGAPGEAAWTPLMRDAVARLLIDRGFQLFLFDANANCQEERKQDFDLWLTIHYDADIYGKGGGFADWPDPSVDDVNERSEQLARAINSIYFPLTNIPYAPQRSNGNTRFHYMWKVLTPNTPCVIIECGTNNRDNLQNRTEEVSVALARAICFAFKVPYDPPPPPPPNAELEALKVLIEQIKGILYGKGWPWTKINKLKKLLPK